MSNKQGNAGGLLGSYSASDPTMNVPVTSSGGAVSPYLNFNPAYIAPDPNSQFIYPEGAGQTRGRMELTFSTIGGSVLAGGTVGGLNGVYNGLKSTTDLKGVVRRTQMLNFITKQGASTAQTFGTIGLLYSLLGIGISVARGADDELNTLGAGTITGLLYKSPAGLRASLGGGAMGLGLTAVYCLITGRDRLKQIAGFNS